MGIFEYHFSGKQRVEGMKTSPGMIELRKVHCMLDELASEVANRADCHDALEVQEFLEIRGLVI